MRITDDLPTNYVVSEKLNMELHRMFRLAEDIIKLAVGSKLDDTISFVTNTFKPDLDTNKLVETETSLTSKQLEENKLNLDLSYQMDE